MAKRLLLREIAVIILMFSLSPGLISQQNGIQLMPGSAITAPDGSEIIITDGSLVNNGSFITQGNNTVIFNGNTLQEIGGVKEVTFSNLTVNNTAGLSITGAAANVSNILRCNGLLETNGNMILLSGAEGTALIDGGGTGSVSGNVTIQRFLPTGFGYMYFSSPFTSAKVSELGDEAIESIYGYNENMLLSGMPASGWFDYDNPINTLVPMSGYAINLGPDSGPITVDITGEVNNGDMTLTVYNHDQLYTNGFNLVGNPYPSPVDWNLIEALSNNIDDAVYYFSNSDIDQYGGMYVTYINGVSSDGRATNIIPSMQGFFIHVTDGQWPVEGKLVMNNSVRVNDLDHPFIKSGKGEQPKLLRLSAFFSTSPQTKDYTVVYFDEQATPEFDGQFDALKLLNTDINVPSIFSITPVGTKLSINSMANPGGKTLLVPLGIITQIDGNIRFSVSALDPSLNSMKISLIDSVAGAKRELALNSEYSVDLNAGECTGRFYLKFEELTTSVSRTTEENPGILETTTKGGVLRLKINRIEGTTGSLRIYDLDGRMLIGETVRETGYYYYPGLFSNGIYIIAYRTGSVTASRKVVMVN